MNFSSLFSSIRRFLSDNSLNLSFVSLVALTSFRFLGYLDLPIEMKISSSLCFFFLLLSLKDWIIPIFYNSSATQFILFICFSLENLIQGSLIWLFFFSATITYIFLDFKEILLFFAVFFFYSNFRNLIFKEELIQEGHPLYKLEKEEELTWEKLMDSLQFLLSKTYQFSSSSSSSLPSRVNRIAFPYVAKRYIFETVMDTVKSHGNSLKYVVACFGALLSGGALLYTEDKKYTIQQNKVAIEQNKIAIERKKLNGELFNNRVVVETDSTVKLQELDTNTRNVLIKQHMELFEFYKKHKKPDYAEKVLADIEKLRDPTIPVLRQLEGLKMPPNIEKTAFEGGFSQDIFTYFI